MIIITFIVIIIIIHRSILNQTTDGNVIQAFKEYSLDPKSRFGNPVKIF